MRRDVRSAMKVLAALCTGGLLAACSAAVSPSAPGATAPATVPTAAPAAQRPPSTDTPSGGKAEMPPFPRCAGMQRLDRPVEFDWPNLKASMEQFIASAWQYYSCDQPPAEVMELYRSSLAKPPYALWEANWLEREQGVLGIYFSEAGLWYYIWYLPQPGDPQRSYIVVAESFASVEC